MQNRAKKVALEVMMRRLCTRGLFPALFLLVSLTGCKKDPPCGKRPPVQLSGELASQVKGFVPAGTVVCEVQEKDQDFKSSTSHDVRLEVSFTEEGIQAHRNRYIREFEASHNGWTRGVWSKDSMMLTWYRLDKDCPVTYVTTPAGRSEQGLCASLRITFHGKGGPIPPGASILVSSSRNK